MLAIIAALALRPSCKTVAQYASDRLLSQMLTQALDVQILLACVPVLCMHCSSCLQTWLRVYLGFHTWPQVLVGAALGASTAVTWFKLGTAWALPSLQKSAAGLGVLYAATVLGSAGFGYKVITGWFKERRRKQQLSGKVKVAVDTFAEEEFEELAQQLAQQPQSQGTRGFCHAEQQQQSVEGSHHSGSGAMPSAGTTPSFAS